MKNETCKLSAEQQKFLYIVYNNYYDIFTGMVRKSETAETEREWIMDIITSNEYLTSDKPWLNSLMKHLKNHTANGN